jgi:cell division protein FtsL
MRKVTLIAGVMLGLLAFMVFQVEYKVRSVRAELEMVNKQIALYEEDIHVLEAEWAYLNQPRRVKQLAANYLNMENVSYMQLAGIERIPERRIALSKATPAAVRVAQIASVSGGVE